jgi:hypothetical protein
VAHLQVLQKTAAKAVTAVGLIPSSDSVPCRRKEAKSGIQ